MQYQATPPVPSRDESERPIHNVTLMDTFASSMREIPLMSSPTHTDNSLIFTPHGEAELSRMTELSLAVDTTDVTFYDHPELQAGLDLMVTFHHHLQAFNNTSEAIELIDALEKTCNEQVGHLKTLEYSKHIRKALDELKLERDTWQLIRALYTDRLFYDQDDDNSLNMEELVPRTDGEIIEEFFINVGDVRQAQVVIDWLEKIAASDLDDLSTKVKYFADSVSWDSTMHDIQYGLNKGHIVTEVDPDCRSRQKKPLSELDEKDELSLSKHLFECIRAGELDKAQQLCIQCGQSWRAATFNGWKLYHDPNLYKDIGSDLDDVGGNPTRDLWKSSCWNLMKCATFGNYEKAIYAAMSGNLSCLLKVCNTWYDCLWSYYRVMVDVLVEKKLRTSNRYPSDYQFVQLPDEYWDAILTPEVIFQEIEANPSQNIKRQCLNYYHLTQKHIILGSLDDLIDEMYFWLKEKQSTNGHIMRFMAHIALFIRSISSTYNVRCSL
jgi:nuclear pore complex protein Nup107